MPRVSVLIPCYNAQRFVGRTLDSLRAQTFEDWDCLVVDDGSTDQSAQVVDAHVAQDSRIQLIHQSNARVATARNAAYAASSTDSAYVMFLDSDDFLEPTMLEVLVSHMEINASVCFAYFALACIS